jgi:hypothetical protein
MNQIFEFESGGIEVEPGTPPDERMVRAVDEAWEEGFRATYGRAPGVFTSPLKELLFGRLLHGNDPYEPPVFWQLLK